jgi:MFS family permease
MNRNLILVAISMFTWGLGEGLFLYFQPIYLAELGADPVMIGVIFGAMGIAMALAQIPAGILSDRIGSRPIMWASWLLGTAAGWTMALAPSLPFFIVGLLIYGLTSFVVAPMNAYVTSVRGKWAVARALTFVAGLYSVGTIIGPIVGGLLGDRLGLRSIYFVAASIFIISTIIILFVEPAPKQHHAESNPDAGHILKNRQFLLFAGLMFFTLFALVLPQPLTPSYLHDQGLTNQQVGLLGAFGSLGNALANLVLGSMRPLAGLLVGQGMMVVFSLLLWQGGVPVWFGMGYVFVGGYRLVRAMVLANARTMIRSDQTGLAYGFMETINAVASILAPLLAGFLYSHNPSSVYVVAIIAISVMLAISAFVLPKLHRTNGSP